MPRKKKTQVEQETQEAEFRRWRALVRNRAFMRDLTYLGRLAKATQGQVAPEAYQRYGDEIKRVTDKWGLFHIPPAAFSPLNHDPHSLEQCYLWQRDAQGPYPIYYSPVEITELKDNRFVFLRVDATKPLGIILASIEAQLGAFYKTSRAKSRQREPTIDPFKVWDMHHLQKKKLLQITRELQNVQGNPRYDFSESLHKQVCRAYAKAKRMITSIKPQPAK